MDRYLLLDGITPREVPIYLDLMYLVTALVPPRDSMLGQLSGKEETGSGLYFARSDGRSLVVVSKSESLSSNALEDVTDKRVHDAHGLGGDASVRVDLLLLMN
jgi:hypothetical protein